MKKSYLMIAAAATLFAACASNDEFKEISNQESVIGFSTLYQKATKATENSGESYTWSLSNHHANFKVWGYKNTSADAVFDGEEVRWDTSLEPDAWTYTNNRYWDKAATTYQFYACAPYSATTPFKFNGVTNLASQNAGYFTIETAYTKVGENVSPKSETTAVESWKSRNPQYDVDLMIAAPAVYTDAALTNAYTHEVTLNFIHILSRLNITVKTSAGFFPTVTTGDKIKVTNITIGHMKNSGTFNENADLGGANLSDGTSLRWSATGDNDFSYDINYDATQEAKYVIEALMMPQTAGVETISLNGSQVTGNTENKPFLKIAYSIYNNAGDKHEDYVAYYNLASLFGKSGDQTLDFNEGWQNTLNITISPDQINFDGNVAVWDDKAPDTALIVK